MDFYDKIKPHYDALFDIANGLKNKQTNLIIQTDSLLYTDISRFIKKTTSKDNLNISIKYSDDQKFTQSLLNGFCDIFILRENLKIENNKICKKILPTEKIGIIAHKSLFEKYNKIDVLIINEFLILKEINYQKEAFSYIEKNYNVKVKNKRTITNIDLFIGLLNGCGYTLNNNDYFNKIGGVSNGFIFIHPSDLCFSNRYVYFLNNTPWMEYIYDFIGSSD